MAEKKTQQPQEEQSLSEILQIRRDKPFKMQQEGNEPHPHTPFYAAHQAPPNFEGV